MNIRKKMTMLMLLGLTLSSCTKDLDDNLNSTTSELSIGDYHQGGKIFYIFNENDKEYVQGEAHGLIAAINDQKNVKWGPTEQLVGNTHTNLGSGLANTNSIIASIGNGENAASICGNLELNGFTDWYLPSLEELNKLYLSKDIISGFTHNFNYHTSSEHDSGNAWVVNMTSGEPAVVGAGSKTVAYQIRAIRTF